jgi:hypothetical protein
MTALMSTKFGVHGKTEATKVPRKTLVAALDTRMTPTNFYQTVELQRGVWWAEIRADLTQGKAFTNDTPRPPANRRARAGAADGRAQAGVRPADGEPLGRLADVSTT